jgi:hypothetical protein
VSDDSRTAYVTLQENNAIAEIDVRTGRVNAVRALGYKDFDAPLDVDYTADTSHSARRAHRSAPCAILATEFAYALKRGGCHDA